MLNLKSIFLSFIILFSATISFAQQANPTDTSKRKGPHVRSQTNATSINIDKKMANGYFNVQNYWAALQAYLEQYKDNPKDVVINYRIGFCYLNTNVGKAKAIPYLEYAVKQKDVPKDAYLLLGKAYHSANRFDDAIDAYKTYKEGAKVKDDALNNVDRLMEMCDNGKDLITKPVDVKFENLGKGINSNGSDYNPYVNANETLLIFCSQRQGNTGGSYDNPEDLGVYPADVYYSVMKDGAWTKAKNLGYTVNTEEAEECVGMNAQGDKLFLFFDSKADYADLYMTKYIAKQWQKPESLGQNVNTKSVESGAALSSDGNTLIFSSDRKGGTGGKDLYKSQRLPNGNWSIPTNLGTTINTQYDEDGPFFSADDKTLYFSSKGFNSMGGYDIFKSEYDSAADTWSEPVNLGYPVNTSDDNIYFSITADKKHGYIAAQRDDGFGDLDIYRITFNSAPGGGQKYTVVRGFVSSDTAMIGKVKIILSDTTGKTLGIYNAITSGGKFIMIIPPGKYHIATESGNFKPYTEDFSIPEKQQPAELPKTISLAH